jgi:hypothetical protein
VHDRTARSATLQSTNKTVIRQSTAVGRTVLRYVYVLDEKHIAAKLGKATSESPSISTVGIPNFL